MTEPAAHLLPSPPFYFPLRHGRYDVAPGLSRFGRDLGGGAADRCVFQFDRTFHRYRDSKRVNRATHGDRYFCSSGLRETIEREVARFIAGRLVTEHPGWFREVGNGDRRVLRCELTGEAIRVTAASLDAIAMQLQEDVAIISVENGRHWLSAAHVCFPNGWAPAEKVGRTFAAMHEPVPGMEAMNRRGDHFAAVMVNAVQGLVRFAWGITFDDRLDHHPALPRTPFDPAHPRAFLRVERQTVWGFPPLGAALFTIRTYLYDCVRLRRDEETREPLVAALKSMSAESRSYKGIADRFDGLLAWLSAPGSASEGTGLGG